jgi:hypothetical protein
MKYYQSSICMTLFSEIFKYSWILKEKKVKKKKSSSVVFVQLSGVGGRSDWRKCEQDIDKENRNYLTCSKRKKTCDLFLSKHTGSRNNNTVVTLTF